MATPNPMQALKLPPPPPISAEQRYVAGHAVTVHGLAELPKEGASHVSVLWLYHGRLRSPADMADIAARCVGAWNSARLSRTQPPSSRTRGLIAIAFDQRNHGGRVVSPLANEAWRAGNPAHAQDMFGMIAGVVVDTGLLIDLVQGSLFPEREEGFIDSHYALGVSLGGHGVWQILFADDRVKAGVSIIGCPDYMFLMADRARLSKLPTFCTTDDGASFLGSKDFPPDLVRACKRFDARGLVFGTTEPAWPLQSREAEARVKDLLVSRLRSKSLLNCSGGDDKLVPYRCSKPFIDFLKSAVKGWGRDLQFSLDDRVYPGIGHSFSEAMVTEAVEFIVDAVAKSDAASTAMDEKTAKI